MGPLHKQKWDDPLSSVGEFRGMTEIKTSRMFKGKKCCWEAKDDSPASTALKQLLPKINELFHASGNRVPDSAMVLMDIFMFGDVAEDSVPYIMFSCPNTCRRARIEAMNLVRRSGLLKEFPGLRVFHWEFPPHVPDPKLTVGRHMRITITGTDQLQELGELSPGDCVDRTALEISLSARCNGEVDASTSRNSTVGAIVQFGECVLYFTAAHILLPQRDVIHQRQRRHNDLTPFPGYDSDSSSDSDFKPNYSTRSPSVNHGTGLSDTQAQSVRNSRIPTSAKAPSLINGEVFFKSHELDFALLDLSNLGVPRSSIPEREYTTVSPIRPGFTEVVACTGSRRHLHGQMSGRSSYVRFPHGSIYQEVYPIFSRVEIHEGDSGTIVRDAATGRVYGHIVVASIATRTAFIVPAMQVLRSIPWLTSGASSVYTRLNSDSGQFRLVRLLPPSLSGDYICCELSLACLGDHPKYQAVSYRREDREECRPILLNGQPWKVTSELATMLRQLRTVDQVEYMWIDALCVDQTNFEENTCQTELCGDIYRSCDVVVSWIGNTYDGISSHTEWEFSSTYSSFGHHSQLLS